MWPLVLLLYVGCIGADVIMTIYLDINRWGKANCNYNIPRKLALNEVFQVSVTSNYEIISGNCNINQNQNFLYYSNGYLARRYDTSSARNYLKATLDMNNVWECSFEYSWHTVLKLTANCAVNMNIVRNTVMGYLTVSNNEVAIKFSGQADFDTYGYYSFFESELVAINCLKTDQDPDFLRLSYNNGEKTITTDLHKLSPVEMYIRLTADNDDAYIDCNIQNLHQAPTQSYVTRVYFKLNSAYKAILSFQVNGLTLTSNSVQEMSLQGSHIYDNYWYYDGEELNINILKDEYRYGRIQCCWNGTSLDGNYSFPFSTILTSDNRKLLNCSVEVKNQDGQHPNTFISLSLIPNLKYSQYIKGLKSANILLQYWNNSYTKVIEYEYDADNNLSLACYSSVSSEWEYNAAEVEKVNDTALRYDGNLCVKESVFKLHENQTSAVLNCNLLYSNPKNNTIVRLIRKKKSVVFTMEKREKDFNGTKFTFVVCGTALLVVIVVLLARSFFRKRKHSIQSIQNLDPTNMNYETLPGHHEGPMPMPIQWSEEYVTTADTADSETYTVPYAPRTVHELYSTPLPKHLRKLETVTYSELEVGVKDSAYTTVGDHQGPKRGFDDYAQILNTTPTAINEDGDIRRNNTNDHGDSDSSSGQYANLFDDDSYVNADSKDDTELYCEVNVKKF